MPDIFVTFHKPSPLGTLLASLMAFIALATVIVLLLVALRGGEPAAGGGPGTRMLRFLRALDRGFIRYGALVVGTRGRQPAWRAARVVASFAALVAGGVALPFAPAMASLLLGLVALLVVFRHWSLDETERGGGSAGTAPALTFPIEGDLTLEMAMACGFLLFIVPLAFARLHAAGYAFQMTEEAGPFAFVFYMLIELLKLGTVVDYYDLFADRIDFGRLQQAHHPVTEVKYVMLLFRAVFDLIILVALKRMFDIGRRVAAGLDLRGLREALESPDDADDFDAIARLKALAGNGHAEALALLRQVAQGSMRRVDQRRRWFSTEVRAAAAAALAELDQLAPAIEAWQQLLQEASAQGQDPAPDWSASLAALQKRQARESAAAQAHEAEQQVAALRSELAALPPGSEDAARRQRELARALRFLANRGTDTAPLEQALGAIRAAQAAYNPETQPRPWAVLEREAGQLLRRLGQRRGETARLEQAVAAFAASAQRLHREEDETLWASVQYERALALRELYRREAKPALLAQARRAIRDALRARPDMKHWVRLRTQLEQEAARPA